MLKGARGPEGGPPTYLQDARLTDRITAHSLLCGSSHVEDDLSLQLRHPPSIKASLLVGAGEA